MAEELSRISLYLDFDLKMKLVDLAAEESRSVNNMVIVLLQEALKARNLDD